MRPDLIGRPELAADRFVIPLHMNEGLDEQALHELQEVIDRCGAAWRELADVPKRGALILAELFPAIGVRGAVRQQCAPADPGGGRRE